MRLLTRFDFDGVCCAALLREVGVVDTMEFIHPKELQDGNVEVSENDVLANVPFVEGCGLWFDHHSSEHERLDLEGCYKGASWSAPSAARVIFDYYGGVDKLGKFNDMVYYCDKVDSADLSVDDVLNPSGWVLLGFICDPRTGLGAQKGYRIPQFEFMTHVIEHIRSGDLNEIMAHQDVMERVDKYFELDRIYHDFMAQHSRQDGPAIITDTRGMDDIPSGNRFLVYSLFPTANISIRLMDGKGKQNTIFSVGHSIINRSSSVDVGSLMLKYGGGGHKRVGTCQVENADVDKTLAELVAYIKSTESD